MEMPAPGGMKRREVVNHMSKKCMEKTEVYSRVVGYFRPVQQWNKGKQEEFKDRQEFVVEKEQDKHECHSRN